MRMYVPCARVNGRTFVMAAPIDPVLRVFAFTSPQAALAARAAVISQPWKIETEGDGIAHMDAISIDEEHGDAIAWETDIKQLAVAGLAGPSGFGVDVCEFIPPETLKVIESYTISVEEVDFDSVRARFEIQVLE